MSWFACRRRGEEGRQVLFERRVIPWRGALLGAVWLGWLMIAATGRAAEPASWQWRLDDSVTLKTEEGFTAIASDSERGVLAIADLDGVHLIQRDAGGDASLPKPIGDSPPIRFARVRGVTDLEFDASGQLWIAAASGLWRLRGDGRLDVRAPGVGEQARFVTRIALQGGLAVVATGAGVYCSDELNADAKSWLQLDAGFPTAPVRAVVVLPAGSASENRVVALLGARLWRADLVRTDAGALAATDVRRLDVNVSSLGEEAPVDLTLVNAGRTLALLLPQRLLVDEIVAAEPSGRWRELRPNLPPGASIRRLIEWRGGYWLATDQGLLTSDRIEGPWRRSAPPAGQTPVREVVVAGGRLYAATARGLLMGERVAREERPGGTAPKRVVAWVPPEPEIAEVQRVVLAYVGLETRRLDALRDGLSKRGWLPLMGLRFGVDRDRGRSWDRDQSVSSGEIHRLYDEDSDHSLDLDGSITLSWNFGDLAYDPESVDLSREARMLIALRDNVLDEVNQLYHERLALKARLLADTGDLGWDARLELELRAAELTAGLDGWTGGWFSRRIEAAMGD